MARGALERDEIVRTLERTARVLEIIEANPFRVRAFQNGARMLAEWSGDLDQAIEEGTLTDLDGIGAGLARIIADLRRTGHSPEVDEVADLLPAGVIELRAIPGLGAKRVARLYRELGIESPAALADACRAGRVRTLSGFGARTEERLLARVERYLTGEAAPGRPLRDTDQNGAVSDPDRS